jgi:5-amino-6-(5-phosphoribosylamino)uracil reductase
MELDVLFPPGPPATADALCAAMAPWEHAHADRPYVLVNMVESLDGQITLDGGSTGLGGDGDKAMFHALRGVVDAVLAGTGTAKAERYGRLVRDPARRAAREALGLAPDPVMLFITRSGNVVWDAPLFDTPEQRVGIATGAAIEVPDVRADVRVIELADPEPRAALAALGAAFGLRSVLCEGGPTLNRSLVEAGVLDEWFVTLSPMLAGGDSGLLTGDPLPDSRPLELRWVLRSRHELLLRYACTV